MDQIAFRSLCPDDIPALRVLCGESFPIDYPDSWYDFVTSGYFYTCGAFEHASNHTLAGVIIAENKSFKQIQPEDSSIIARHMRPEGRIGYILTLGVASTYRQKGLGSYLLQNALTTLQQGNCLAVYLHVLSANTNAINFYRRRHFHVHAHFPYYYTIKGVPAAGSSFVRYMNGGYRDYPAPILALKRLYAFLLLCLHQTLRRFVPFRKRRQRTRLRWPSQV